MTDTVLGASDDNIEPPTELTLEQKITLLEKRLNDKDAFIEQLKTENAGVRGELASQNRLQEMLDKAMTKPTEPPNPDATPKAGEQDAGLDPKKVEQLIDEVVTKKAQEAKAATNRQKVIDELKQTFGSNFAPKVQERLQELGVGQDFFESVCARSPQAALTLLGAAKQKPVDNTGFVPPRNQVNTSNFKPNAEVKGWSHFEAMRKSSDPKVREQYWSPSVQNEIHRKAMEYAARGEDFLST